ncbi:MAG: vanadium-dependent haloperoxidase [Pyrinomonadaceae bacterium]
MNEKPNPIKEEANEEISEVNAVSRRKFFGNMGKAAITVAALGSAPLIDPKARASAQRNLPGYERAVKSLNFKIAAAQDNFFNTQLRFPRTNNGDESRYANKIGNFSKGLPHQSNGEVDVSAYNQQLLALNSQVPADFELIPLAGDRKLANPQSGLAMDIEGRDCFGLRMAPAPAFASRENAAEIAENYWMALLRDVPFEDYPNSPTAQAAAADLNIFGNDFKGAKNAKGQVTPELLFRGLTPGDKTGPYLSQFFYQTCNFGANKIDQQIKTARAIADGGADYMIDFDSWLAVQNGVSPQNGDIFDPTLRYMRNGRDIGQYVHVDVLFQSYFQAFLVLAGMGAPFDSGNPYLNSATQDGFATFGGPHVAALLCEVSTRALKSIWNQKWFVHRRLRPEVFAERVDRTAFHGADYPIHQEILDSINTASRLGGFIPAGNAFLPQAFPEGSPMHPSYGAGHATVAGACVTVLKAFFDESFVIPNPVMPDPTGQVLVPYTGDPLTVGGELNKLASNISLGRNIAGVHWRSDGTESNKLGEELAITVMRDHRNCYNEQFGGFSLTKFNGTTITV